MHKFHIYIYTYPSMQKVFCRYLLNHCVGVESSTGTLTLMADQVVVSGYPFWWEHMFQVIHSHEK